ncbi:pyrroloquinoline quinone biosynthesis protein PqqC [Sesbania bispinosa]|nr:pyrroloquinoline quinone biosynthesis protein PqqC [Sesbania bispinosa]
MRWCGGDSILLPWRGTMNVMNKEGNRILSTFAAEISVFIPEPSLYLLHYSNGVSFILAKIEQPAPPPMWTRRLEDMVGLTVGEGGYTWRIQTEQATLFPGTMGNKEASTMHGYDWSKEKLLLLTRNRFRSSQGGSHGLS